MTENYMISLAVMMIAPLVFGMMFEMLSSMIENKNVSFNFTINLSIKMFLISAFLAIPQVFKDIIVNTIAGIYYFFYGIFLVLSELRGEHS